MHNNRNNRETVIIPQTIIVPTKSIIVASLVKNFPDVLLLQPRFLSAHRWILFNPRRPREINTSSSNMMENSYEAVYKCEYYKSKTRLHALITFFDLLKV